jgi:hypothetical protein
MFDPSLSRPLPPAVLRRRMDVAVEAARVKACGRGRAEVRDVLVAELRAQGLMPAPPGVELMVDLIAGSPVQRAAHRGAYQARLGAFAVGLVSAAARHRPLPRWDVTGARFVSPRLPLQPVDVILDPDAGLHLAVGDADTFEVWLGPGAPSSSAGQAEDRGAGLPVAVFRGDYHVGVLDPDTSAAYWPLVQDAGAAGQTVVTMATRKQAGDDQWRLLINLPHPRHGTRART